MISLRLLFVVLATLPLAACELAGDIFEAGLWIGAIMVVAVIAVVAFVVSKLRG